MRRNRKEGCQFSAITLALLRIASLTSLAPMYLEIPEAWQQVRNRTKEVGGVSAQANPFIVEGSSLSLPKIGFRDIWFAPIYQGPCFHRSES